jgi:hypothetical protein
MSQKPRFLAKKCGAPKFAQQIYFGAGEGIRTLDIHLGKVALYH